MAGAKKYQQVLSKHCLDYLTDCEALEIGRRAHTTRQFITLEASQMDGMDCA
jgi:hypothetical protein